MHWTQALVAQLKKSLQEVQDRVQPFLNEVKKGHFATQQGVSYLEAKHMLLLSYSMHIVMYLMIKVRLSYILSYRLSRSSCCSSIAALPSSFIS